MKTPSERERKLDERYLTIEEWRQELASRYGKVTIAKRGDQLTATRRGDVVSVWAPGSSD